MKKESTNTLTTVTIYAIAMAFLEAAVVVYLRALFYPDGFRFPLVGYLNPSILGIEWIREFATIVMLVAIALLASKKLYGRFAYFLYAFAVWDIFYYVFLKLTLDWPASIFDWDLLFLIPWPWIGPVLAPVLCSALFITLSLMIIDFEDKGKRLRIEAKEWVLFIAGSGLVLYTWLYDYSKMILLGNLTSDFVPASYNWLVFSIGFILAVLGIALFYRRTSRQK